MAITTKTRKDLKSYFVKNAIPSESNFAELIDAPLNQADDGVFKLAGEPLSVVAAAGGQKRALRLYADYPTANPDWLISLNPAQDPADAATNRAGFGIADGAGNTRLFLDPTGKLGLGTNEPAGAIDVRIGGSTDPWHRFVVGISGAWGDAGVQHVTIGGLGASGIMFNRPHVVWNGDRAAVRYGRTSAKAGETYWDVGVREDGRFAFQSYDNGGAGEQVMIGKAGLLTAKAGMVFDGAAGHIDRDGAIYRNTDGQCYITVDDNLYIRDSGAASWSAQFDTNSGSLNLKGALNAATGARVSGNGGALDLEGTDHVYIEYYPQTIAKGRKGYIGYGGANTTTLSVVSEAGPLQLTGTSVTVTGNTQVSGALCIGATSTTYPLDVRVSGNGGWDRFVVTTTKAWGDGENQYVTIGAGGAPGIMLWNPHVPWYAPESRASIRYGRTGGAAGKTYWDAGVRADGGFGFDGHDDGGIGDALKISKTGNVTAPGFLRASGGLIADGNLSVHLETDGAFYRFQGQSYITVDDNLYIRQANGNIRMHFDTINGVLKTDVLALAEKWRFSAIGDGHGNDEWLRMFGSNNSGYYGGFAAGKLYSTKGSVEGSDLEMKTDVESLDPVLDKLLTLRGVNFQWKDNAAPEREIGLIAQEVEAVFPELVQVGPEGLRGIKYSGFAALLIEAIKQQQAQIDVLQRTLRTSGMLD